MLLPWPQRASGEHLRLPEVQGGWGGGTRERGGAGWEGGVGVGRGDGCRLGVGCEGSAAVAGRMRAGSMQETSL